MVDPVMDWSAQSRSISNLEGCDPGARQPGQCTGEEQHGLGPPGRGAEQNNELNKEMTERESVFSENKRQLDSLLAQKAQLESQARIDKSRIAELIDRNQEQILESRLDAANLRSQNSTLAARRSGLQTSLEIATRKIDSVERSKSRLQQDLDSAQTEMVLAQTETGVAWDCHERTDAELVAL